MKKNSTYYIALGGVLAALSVVIMFLAAVIPYVSIALPALAGILLIATVIEAGPSWAILIFIVVSLLSVLFVPDKEPVVYYVFFFGHYPIAKSYIERVRLIPVQWIIKFLYFNICLAAAYEVMLFTGIMPRTYNCALYLGAIAILLEITFLIYDFAVAKLVIVYVDKIKKIIKF